MISTSREKLEQCSVYNTLTGRGVASFTEGPFDGDTCSYVVLYTEESIREVKNILSKASSYLSPGGGFKTQVSNFTIDLVIHNMTRRA